MESRTTIHACTRGHRDRDSLLSPGARTTCAHCDLIELVALAYGDCQTPPRGARLLTFRTELISDAALLGQVIAQVPAYNAWRSHAVRKALRPIFPKLMGVEFGREASPVLYALVPYWRHQAVEWRGAGSSEPIPSDERKAITKEFLEAMERVHADELSDEGHALRAWWD